MDRALVVSASENSLQILQKALDAIVQCKSDGVKSGGDVRRRMLEIEYDLLIINMPLTDETGAALAVDMAESTVSGIILIVASENADYVQHEVGNYGVFVVSKPLNMQILAQAVKFITASRKRMLRMRDKQVELQKKIDDLKVISRAKCCLIQYLNMTERQAHRHIEKQAMDMRCSRRTIAEQIIKTYEM